MEDARFSPHPPRRREPASIRPQQPDDLPPLPELAPLPDLIGQTISARRPFSWAAVVFLVLGVGLAAAAVAVRSPHLAVAALGPCLLAVALWWARDPALEATFCETALEVGNPPRSIPYGSLQGVRTRGNPTPRPEKAGKSFAMLLIHDEGVQWIPARLNVPSQQVYRFLVGRFPSTGSGELNPVLADYVRRQGEAYGPESVVSYRARPQVNDRFPARRSLAVSLAILFTGIGWVLTALGMPGALGWLAPGIPAVCLGLLFSALGAWDKRPRIKNRQEAGLVIGPAGLALVQGAMRGELRWEQVKDVRLNTSPRHFQFDPDTSRSGIALIVEGAQIYIADIYDRPVSLIYDSILYYW